MPSPHRDRACTENCSTISAVSGDDRAGHTAFSLRSRSPPSAPRSASVRDAREPGAQSPATWGDERAATRCGFDVRRRAGGQLRTRERTSSSGRAELAECGG